MWNKKSPSHTAVHSHSGTDTVQISADTLKDLTISAINIEDLSITAAKIANLTITADKIGNFTITGNKIANDTITGMKLVDLTISQEKITDAAINAQKLASEAVEEAKIAADAVTATKINVAALHGTTGNLNSDTVDTAQIVDDAVTSLKVLDDAITAAKIAVSGLDGTSGDVTANHITANMLQADCVITAKIYAGAVTTDEIAANTIVAGNIFAGTITATELGTDCVITTKLQADSVTAPKINVVGLGGESGRIVVADATDADEVTGGVNTYATTLITAGKIVISGATNLEDWRKTGDLTMIDGGDISTGTVTATQIAANTITANEIYANTITASEIASGTITGTEISASAIIVAGTGNNIGVLNGNDATYRIYAGHATPASAPFRVTQAGALVATSATITGIITVSATSSGIASFSDAGDLVTVDEASVNALNLTNAPAEAGADVTGSNTAADITGQGDLATTNEADANVLNMTNAPAEAGATAGATFGTNISGGGSGNNQVGNDSYITTITDSAITVTNLAAINADLGTITAGSISGVTGAFSGAVTAGANSDLPLAYITESYTAGESITTGDVLYMCKAGYTDRATATDDTWINSAVGYTDSTYCANTTVYIYREDDGANCRVGLVKPVLTGISSNCAKAVLRLYLVTTPAATARIYVKRVTSAWSEASCPSWNTKPTWDSKIWGTYYYSSPSAGWIDIDITALVREWIAGTYTNYGVIVTGNAALPNSVAFNSSEAASNKPHIRSWDEGAGTGYEKAFKAKANDFLTCFPLIGIATNSVSADETVKTRVLGRATSNSNLANAGDFAYVSPATAGGLVGGLGSHSSDDFVVKVGTIKTSGANSEIIIEQPTYVFHSKELARTSGHTGKQVINCGFRPSLIQIQAWDASTEYWRSTGTSRCAGSGGNIVSDCFYPTGAYAISIHYTGSINTHYIIYISAALRAVISNITSYGFELDWKAINANVEFKVQAWG